MTHLMGGQSVKGRWIRPLCNDHPHQKISIIGLGIHPLAKVAIVSAFHCRHNYYDFSYQLEGPSSWSGGVSSTLSPVNSMSKFLVSVSLNTWGLNGGDIWKNNGNDF